MIAVSNGIYTGTITSREDIRNAAVDARYLLRYTAERYFDSGKHMSVSNMPLSWNWRVRKLLRIMSDGKWHREVRQAGIGIGTIHLCVEQGFIQERQIKLREPYTYRAEFRITSRGRKTLRTGRLVTRTGMHLAHRR